MMAVLMGVGMAARFRGRGTSGGRDRSPDYRAWRRALGSVRGFADAVIGPFVEFFRVYGWVALLMLAMISLYRLPEFLMGPMANPYYHDLGLSKDTVGAVRASIGLVGVPLGHCRGRPQRGTHRLFPDDDHRLIMQSVVHRVVCRAGSYTGPDVRVSETVMAVETSAPPSPASRSSRTCRA